jgi:hypothetical protein
MTTIGEGVYDGGKVKLFTTRSPSTVPGGTGLVVFR